MAGVTAANLSAPVDGPTSLLRVREAFIDDYDRIAALQRRNAMPIKSYEHWRAFWTGNPLRKNQAPDGTIGWVVEKANGEIVGSIGNIPLEYSLTGRRLRVATPCGWVVDPEFRGYSIPLLSRFLAQRDIDLFLFATAGAAAEPIFRSLKFPRVPVGTWNETNFWVTRYVGLAQTLLRTNSVSFPAMVRTAAAAAPRALWTRLRALSKSPAHSLGIDLCSDFGSRFDAFWNELRRQNESVLLALRTREVLKWHFGAGCREGRACILTASEGSRLRAYGIFDSQDNSALGLKRMRLVDFQALNGFEYALPLIVDRMRQICRKSGVHVLEVIGCWLQRSAWPDVRPPYRRRLSSWAFYYKAPNRELSDALNDPRVWAPSSYDGDASL